MERKRSGRGPWLHVMLAGFATLVACVGEDPPALGSSSSGDTSASSSGGSSGSSGSSSGASGISSASSSSGGSSSSSSSTGGSSGEPDAGLSPILLFLSEPTTGDFAAAGPTPWLAADARCAAAAAGASLVGEYRALLSYRTTNAEFGAFGRMTSVKDHPIYRPEAAGAPPTLLASNRFELFANGPRQAPRNKADGSQVGESSALYIPVWAGSDGDGSVTSQPTCAQWTTVNEAGRVGNAMGSVGDAGLPTDWIDFNAPPCTTSAQLYCFGPLP